MLKVIIKRYSVTLWHCFLFLIKNSICFLVTKRHGTVKNLVNTDFFTFQGAKKCIKF